MPTQLDATSQNEPEQKNDIKTGGIAIEHGVWENRPGQDRLPFYLRQSRSVMKWKQVSATIGMMNLGGEL